MRTIFLVLLAAHVHGYTPLVKNLVQAMEEALQADVSASPEPEPEPDASPSPSAESELGSPPPTSSPPPASPPPASPPPPTLPSPAPPCDGSFDSASNKVREYAAARVRDSGLGLQATVSRLQQSPVKTPSLQGAASVTDPMEKCYDKCFKDHGGYGDLAYWGDECYIGCTMRKCVDEDTCSANCGFDIYGYSDFCIQGCWFYA